MGQSTYNEQKTLTSTETFYWEAKSPEYPLKSRRLGGKKRVLEALKAKLESSRRGGWGAGLGDQLHCAENCQGVRVKVTA